MAPDFIETRLPLKETRRTMALKVHGVATRMGHRQLADAMEVAIGRIESEMRPRQATGKSKQRGHDADTEPQANNEDFGVYDFGGDDDEDEGIADAGPSGIQRHPHPPEPEGHIKLRKREGENKPKGRSWMNMLLKGSGEVLQGKGKEALMNKGKEKVEQTLHLGPSTPSGLTAPIFSFRKGIASYVRDVVEYELEKEVEKRIKERGGGGGSSAARHANAEIEDEEWYHHRPDTKDEISKSEDSEHDTPPDGGAVMQEGPNEGAHQDHDEPQGECSAFNNFIPEESRDDDAVAENTSDEPRQVQKVYRVPISAAHERWVDQPRNTPMQFETIYRVPTEAATARWGDPIKAREERESRRKEKAARE